MKSIVEFNEENAMKDIKTCISKLRNKGKEDQMTMNKYANLEESDEDSDIDIDNNDNCNISVDYPDFIHPMPTTTLHNDRLLSQAYRYLHAPWSNIINTAKSTIHTVTYRLVGVPQ